MKIIITVLLVVIGKCMTFEDLNYQLETLNQNYMNHFQQYYNNKVLNKTEQGQYLYLLGKMHLYGIIGDDKGRYLLAYFYFKVSAQQKQFGEAYYYLGIMQFYKLMPQALASLHLENSSKSQKYYQLLQYLKNSHLNAVQFSFYMSSLLGNNGASAILGNLNKQGIGMQKNCSTALGYYLSVTKNTNVDIYEFRKVKRDDSNFQKELYSKRKLSFEDFEEDISVIEQSMFYDDDTIDAIFQIAQNFYRGSNGYIRNFTKAAEIFTKLSNNDHLPSTSMLGVCYLQGNGVQLDRKLARKLFEQSKEYQLSNFMLIAMNYFGIDGPVKKQAAIQSLLNKQTNKKLGVLSKYLLGSIIAKGEVKDRNKDDGILMLQQASLGGSSMASVIMGLIFADGTMISYDCWRAVNYLREEAMESAFFLDKFNIAKLAIKKEQMSFALFKYLQLAIAGDKYSFVNALYMLDIQGENALKLMRQSWSIEWASKDQTYKIIREQHIVPEISSFILKSLRIKTYSALTLQALTPLINLNNLEEYLTTPHYQMIKKYIRHKIITVGSKTKGNTLLKYYQYKNFPSIQLLKTIATDNSNSNKLHVIQARYLLGKHYQKIDYQQFIKLQSQKKGTKFDSSKRALQQYKLATKSQFIAKFIYQIEGGSLQFSIIDHFLTYAFVIIVIMALLYIKRTKNLNQIMIHQANKNKPHHSPQNISTLQQSNSNTNEQQQLKQKDQIGQQAN